MFLLLLLSFPAVRAIIERLINVIPKTHLIIGAEVGSGNFAVCKLADYAPPGKPLQKVVFKESKAAQKELIDEISAFDKMPAHANVLRFIGICLDPLGFVVPYLPGGSVEEAVKAEVRAGRSSMNLPCVVSDFVLRSFSRPEAAAANRSRRAVSAVSFARAPFCASRHRSAQPSANRSHQRARLSRGGVRLGPGQEAQAWRTALV